MITKVVLGKLSPTMEEGTIVTWSKREGDRIEIGDVLAEIETDKANMEMEALGEGVLRKILVPAGAMAPVGSLIGVIAKPDEDISKLLESVSAPAPKPTTQASTPTPAPEPAPTVPARLQESPAAPRGRIKASPLARRLAKERGIALDGVTGTGTGGRVIKRDIEAIAEGAPPPRIGVPRPGPALQPGITPGQELPHSNMRRTIARRLAESKFAAPHFYVTVDIDMDAAVALRRQLRQAAETKISYNDLVVRAAALALARFPMVNASWTPDKIVTHRDVHVGVAVALDDGLITPVVRHADRKSVLEIAAEIQALAGRARTKRLRPEEYTGSTFTVSNLGMYGVTEFTAIINPPESCILAVGSVLEVPVVAGEGLRPGSRMKVTLSSDHRVVDGALAAQFLAELRRLLESPISLFL